MNITSTLSSCASDTHHTSALSSCAGDKRITSTLSSCATLWFLTSFKSKIGLGPFVNEAGILPKAPSKGSFTGSAGLLSVDPLLSAFLAGVFGVRFLVSA